MASRITFKTDTENSIACPNNLLWWTFYPSILKEVNENLSNSSAARLFFVSTELAVQPAVDAAL